MKDDEHLEQCAFFEWLALAYPDIYAVTFAIPNGGKRDIRTATKLKKEGVKAGVPDIFIAYTHCGCPGMFIEMKSKNGKLSSAQCDFIYLLQRQKYRVIVCHGWDYARIEVERYTSMIDFQDIINIEKTASLPKTLE